MTSYQRILCPVDLSENSLAAIKLATIIAKETKSKICFLYVAPYWLPEEALMGDDYIQQVVEEDKRTFEGVKPYDESVEYDNLLLRGNPGPEIVKESGSADLIIMSTHGHSGVLRFLLGSVAQYVLRRAKCPTVLIRIPDFKKSESTPEVGKEQYITSVMQQVDSIQEHELIDDVEAELTAAGQSAAPVVDAAGHCIGILTLTDIRKYRSLLERYKKQDPTVVDEMFEVDKYGQRRPDNADFHQVGRHMTSPVIKIGNRKQIQDAVVCFGDHPSIHHLVVVDEIEHPVGLVETNFLKRWMTEPSQSTSDSN